MALPASAGARDPLMALVAPVAPSPSEGPKAPVQRAATVAARGFWLQLGAFAQVAGALGMRDRVAQELQALAPLLAVFSEQRTHRLQAGPFATREEALQAGEQLRQSLRLVPMLVERR
jgi:rare lipoprotein A